MKKLLILLPIILIIIFVAMNQPDSRQFKCSHEYTYFKSDEAFIITRVPALNECKE